MADISSIDKNLKVTTVLGRDDAVLYNVLEDPMTLYGVFHDGERFRRLPEDLAAQVNDGVHYLARHTAGGRVCFTTDSDYVAISCKRADISHFPHMPETGTGGFDLYIRENGRARYVHTFIPPMDSDNYESVIDLPGKEMREMIIHFPLYSGVVSLEVGLRNGSEVKKWSGYTYDVPVVYYGSSITQGGCASTPGGDYISRISHKLDCDYINLGFSGSAKAEPVIMDYLSKLNMSIFVYDYDHNAPNIEHLEKTHYIGYKTVRDANPDLPIIMLPKPTYQPSGDTRRRRDIIEETYKRALDEGDKNVYFIDSAEVFDTVLTDGCTVDGCHPNDFGFVIMADAIGKVIEKILNK